MPNSRFRIVGTAVTLLVLTAPGSVTRAQGPQIKIDFRAVGEGGAPIADLKASDVTVRIAGKPRQVTSLEFVEASGGEAGAEKPVSGPSTPAYVSNVASATGGRTLLLVVDDESIELGREQGLKSALAAIVSGLSPADRVGLLSVRRAGGVNIAPTANHQQVQEAIASLQGHGSRESAQDFRCRTTVTLQQLQALIANAAGETPVHLAFFSAALMAPGEAIVAIGGSDRGSDLCRLTSQNFEALTPVIAGSRAHVYVAHVAEGTSRTAGEAAGGVESVAGVVGAETLRLSGDGEAVARRILGETSAYYVATLAPENSDKNATPQRMEVRVSREGTRVHARPNISLARFAAAGATGRGGKASPRDMLRVATTYSDLPLRAAAYASRNQGDDRTRVVVLFEPDGDAAKVTSAMVGLYTEEDKLVAQWTSQDADLARTPPMAALAVAPGTYRVRVAAVDAAGRSGTVDQQFDATLREAGEFKLSAPLLGPAPTSGGFAPKLLFTATDDAVVSYLEMYSVPKDAALTATLELAASEDAPALGKTEAQVRPGPAEDARIVVGGFSLDSLEPGEYCVRTVISMDGAVVGRATSTLRKSGS